MRPIIIPALLGESISVTQATKGLSYGGGIGLRF